MLYYSSVLLHFMENNWVFSKTFHLMGEKLGELIFLHVFLNHHPNFNFGVGSNFVQIQILPIQKNSLNHVLFNKHCIFV
jgi:hypothetical protein